MKFEIGPNYAKECNYLKAWKATSSNIPEAWKAISQNLSISPRTV